MEILALVVIFSWLGLTALIGALTTRRRLKGLGKAESWFVAGRSIGLVVLWLSVGANIYSAYTFLGLPGYAARMGVRVWAITLYGMISFIIGFIVVPRLWSSAKNRGWLTIADAFEDLYSSKALGAFVAVTGALWSIPYVQLQIQGIGYIIEVAGYGLIDPIVAKTLAFILVAVFTVVGGLVSVIFINALQGAIMLIAIWGIGLLVPIIAFGGFDGLFNTISSYAANPPEGAKFSLYFRPQDYVWASTLLVTAPLAFWLWPNRIQNIFGGKDVDTVKKNIVMVGIYQISQIAAIMVGLTAVGLYVKGLLDVPIYEKRYADMSFMLVVRTIFRDHPWLVGLVGAGALAASISTAAAILHVCGALFSRNAYQRIFKPDASDRELVFSARMFTGLIAIVSFILAILAPEVLISLLLVGYAGIVQFFPPLILKMLKPRSIGHRTALASMSLGMISVALVKLADAIREVLLHTPFEPIGNFLYIIKSLGFYEGFYGLLINIIVIIIGYIFCSLRRHSRH